MKELLDMLDRDFEDKCIQLSQMVSDNKINSTNAKIVFNVMHQTYQRRRKLFV